MDKFYIRNYPCALHDIRVVDIYVRRGIEEYFINYREPLSGRDSRRNLLEWFRNKYRKTENAEKDEEWIEMLK